MADEIVAKAVSFAYPLENGKKGTFPVISGVSFAASSSSLLAVVGPSGCGKSTLLNIVAGLLIPSAGNITYSSCLDRKQRRSAYVFQNPRLVPWLSVLDNALFGLRMAGMVTEDSRRACHERLAAYGLDGHENSLPHKLSGGMQQRVALLRALLSRAKLLLLDEPYAGSDFVLRRQLQTELSEAIKRDKLIAILVTHDLIEAVRLADEVIVLSQRPARVVDTFKILTSRSERLAGTSAAVREVADYVARLEKALFVSPQ